MTLTALTVLGFILAKAGCQVFLELLNQGYVRKHANQIPAAFKDAIAPSTYQKAVSYTLAKSRFSLFELVYGTIVLVLFLYTGLLPGLFEWFHAHLGTAAWASAAYLFFVGVLLSIPSQPVEWFAQFRLEERFGFNTSTQKTWWLDRIKGFFLAAFLGYPLLVLVLKIVEWIGSGWWLWAWAIVLAFQLLMVVLAPIFILPLFNKLTPLPEGTLRDRLLKLGERTGFTSCAILVMDGSKRSRHSNAFFTGFSRFRKIVLFDTLIAQLQEEELEAVLAHEIGHYKKKHIPKMLIASAAGLLLAFFVVAKLAEQPWFYKGFGFSPGNIVPAFLLFSLLSGVINFWFSPIANWISRKFEYQADAYAATVMREAGPLIRALRKLNEKNLSNLTPHPVYSAFYYSHPALIERETALRRVPPA